MIRIYMLCFLSLSSLIPTRADTFQITENDEQITIVTPHLEASIRKTGYVSGVAGGSLLDKKTGVTDLGFGLDIADWIMEPGSDRSYRDTLDEELVYRYDNLYHGQQPKRSIEGPQICTKARKLSPKIIRGQDFIAVQMSFNYLTAAPGKQTGSRWTQTIVFPEGKRYFVSSDRIDTVNSSDAMFLRIDMPGHIKHKEGDTFSHVYLSYLPQTKTSAAMDNKLIPASSFLTDFAPDSRFNYRRARLENAGESLPKRFIRAYRIRDPKANADGPWLAGMTLDPSVVHEAWCHQRGYVCMIEEIGGRKIKAGESFGAAYIVGYFDSVNEMHDVYDDFRGFTGLEVSDAGWKLTR
ncbi:MAG: hypothetical protein AAGG48_06130 [Planctomycetota bacterium]